jgi:hypothetical protein
MYRADAWLNGAVVNTRNQLTIVQNGNSVSGFYEGETVSGDVRGSIYGTEAWFRSRHTIRGTAVGYEFAGTMEGVQMSGEVAMGEYESEVVGAAARVTHPHSILPARTHRIDPQKIAGLS